MEIAKFIVGVILPYVALVVFLAGMIWRICTWKKLPSPPMTLFPAPPTEGANTIHTIKEMLFFPSLFKNDRLLWVLAWVFHAVLALILLGHLRVFTNIDAVLEAFGMSEDAILAMSSGAGGAAGVVILLATILLIVRRLSLPRVNEITGVADYLALLLIGVIITTGNMMRFGSEHFDLALTREYFADLALFQFQNIKDAAALENNLFVVHMLLALLLILWIPFSKILHFGGIFFTHQLVRKN
jgi:[DsrC]-trisulfide reductase subunit M